MSQVNILDVPSCHSSRITGDRLPKKCQFESVTMAVDGFQIPSVVPPLRLKVGVIEIVSGKFETIAGDCGAILRGEWREKQERGGQGCEPTLHGQPRADSSARRLGRDTNRPAP